MRTFVQLRQDLERVRNLCYMVGRREKLCRTFLRLREQTFHKQAMVMAGPPLSPTTAAAIVEANHGPSIYDRLYSHTDAEDHTHDFNTILARIKVESPTPASNDEKKVQPDFNGASNKKPYFNGSVRGKSLYGSDLSSMSSSETDAVKPERKTTGKCTNKSKNLKVETETSSEDEGNAMAKNKTPARRKTKKNVPDRSRAKLRDSSESDKLDLVNRRTLQHMELGSSGSESDALLPLSTNAGSRLGPSVASAIYSDTDSDSQEHHSHSAVLITKAAVKEFSAADISKNTQKNFTCKDAARSDYQDESTKNKENVKNSKKKEYIPSSLIVPQRQAAKKASEIMQRTQGKKENTASEPVEFVKSPGEPLKPTKEKPSGKKQRDNKTPKDTKNNDVYDFDKEFGDGTEILAYVPQRQAAKKAAEHIKSGMGTKPAPPDLETTDGKPKKELPDGGKRKEIKKEESPKKEELPTRKEEPLIKEKRGKKQVPESSNSESSSSDSSSGSSSSESSSDSDVAKSPKQKMSSTTKEPTSSSTTTNTTSSESDNGNQVKNKTANKRHTMNKVADEAVETEKRAVAGRKLKKLPDKKLKTSDGRRGPEFQPPLTEREESGRTAVPKEQQQAQQAQQQSGKKADQRDSKRSGSLQSGSQQPAEQSVLGGSRNNDGLRGVSGAKSTKKSSQSIKQTQQQPSTLRGKDDSGAATSRAKSETRKRKSSEVSAKEDKSNKETSTSFKKVEKKLMEKTSKETEKDKHDITSIKNVPEILESPKTSESTSKMDDKKIKKTSNKNAINTLEEEMKQRRAERDSPKKSSRGLDKLLEKREHLDKLSRSRIAIQQERCNEENKDVKIVASIAKETVKNEDIKNHMSEEVAVLDAMKFEKEDVKKNIETTFEKPLDRKKKTEQKLEIETQAAVEMITVEDNVTKEPNDNICLRSMPDKVSTALIENVTSEKECQQKRRKSVNRSIFSPQHGSKDPSVSELFDFDQDMLTDDIVNDDGFSISRDEERGAAPLSFSFNNELWFKEDSKEDSARETLHLVEKLRMELSKKSNSSQFELESVPAEEELPKKEEPLLHPAEKPTEEQILLQEKVGVQEQQSAVGQQQPVVQPVEIKSISNSESAQMSEDLTCKNHTMEDKRKPCYSSNSNNEHYIYGNEERETAKVTVVERAKLDRAEADERWVPPSMDNFNPSDVQHLNTLIDNQNHRYVAAAAAAAHQFSNDIGTVIPDSAATPDAALVAHLQLNMQDQYLQLQQAHPMERVQQHLEAQHAVAQEQSRVQSLAMIDQQMTAASAIPTQIVDEITPMEMVNRHLIGLPNSEDDQGSEMDRALDKEDVSSDIRQDYTQSGSPYNELNGRPDTRWAESQVLPSRRSTSSSITSASSAEEHAAIPPYKNVPPMSYPPCSMDATPYHSYSETSSYGAGAVSLFPPQACAAPLPYPSPFPPPFGAPFPTPQTLLPHVPKPLEESLNIGASPCTAAFTSSSHNMALTAAMVSPTKVTTPPPPPVSQPQQPQSQQQQQQQQQPPTTQPASSEAPPSSGHTPSLLSQPANSPSMPPSFLNTIAETPASNETVVENVTEVLSADNKSAPSGKKSPSKPTRTSARVTSLQGKSPGKSPRQETTKTAPSSRGRSRNSKGSQQSYRSRGRGRGRGRGRSNQNSSITMVPMSNALHNDDSIQNKLVGTVYDFASDEDSANETNIADLRTMRERKKSTDVNEKNRANEPLSGVANDGSIQSHLSSPTLHTTKKYVDDKKLASPAAHHDHQTAMAKSESSTSHQFADTVMPLLPGPVDMRTYNSTVDQSSSSVHGQPYGNHLLGSFAASVSADSNLPELDDLLHGECCVLKKTAGKQQQLASGGFEEPCSKPGFGDSSAIDPSSVSSFDANKVSLTDSRNQLKVKIKGPFLDANYTPSTVTPLTQQTPVIIAPTATSVSVASGTSNLRRMRKKELLRQYCSQDMNMDDPACGNVASTPSIIIPPINPNRTVITIPKAVASMTSIPTREDYKAVVDANMEKKRRKERGGGASGGSSFLDVVAGEEESSSDRKRGLVIGTVSDRRRGRQTRPTATTVTNSGPPKLKIKIGNSIIGGQEMGNAQDDRSRIRPPKKRLSSIPSTPSMEELRRESMKFRKMIMAGFDNDEKTKNKRDKNGKRKKRQSSKKEARVQILEGGAATPKLIIRLGKPGVNSSAANDVPNNALLVSGGDGDSGQQQQLSSDSKDSRVGPPPPEPAKEETGVYSMESNVDEKQPTDQNAGVIALKNIRSAKVTPIRLKLTRCQEGYELKDPVTSSASVDNNGGSGSSTSATTTVTLVNSAAPLPIGGAESEKATTVAAMAERLSATDVAVPVTETRAEQEEQQPPCMEKQSSKEDDIPLLSQSANHNSPGCPPAPLPQGCQVR